MTRDEALLLELDGMSPQVDPDAWLAPGATLVGDVHVAAGASVWYGSVLRADGDRIEVGAGSNLQDGCVVHADPGLPVVVGAGVTVGHHAVLHGCTVEDGSLVGMGAVVLNGARIGRGSLVAAGAVVCEGMDVPPGSLVAGVPARVRRPLGDEDAQGLAANGQAYRMLAARHRGARRVSATGGAR
ncbi:gamma carbonic anhydrase family protein [Cellulomonas sp. KRMCY2]|uniref:gamma carbonic anhydrase family protein n=1 Tax=Cellulomonas sp. KRMCY2 TaxID=1304865 RepID=UPI00045E6F05|nr:gamma carbonic anhydrase family protein [Cellulomonas sp. KRMCY2]